MINANRKGKWDKGRGSRRVNGKMKGETEKRKVAEQGENGR